jgi:hypothetical protein
MKAFLALMAAFGPALASANPQPLQLGGLKLVPASCAVRQTLWIEHYEAHLLLPPGTNVAAVGDPTKPKALRMQVMNPKFMPAEIPSRWRDALDGVVDAQTMARLRTAYRNLGRGDTVLVAYAPGRGVQLQVNDKPIGQVQGHAAVDALLKTWAEDQPPAKKLHDTAARNPCRNS